MLGSETSSVAITPHPYRWVMLGGVWFSYFVFGLTSAALAPLVLPVIRDLGMNHSQMGSVLGGWQLVYIGSAMACGAFLDRVGIRRGIMIAGLIIAASNVFRSISVDYVTLFLAVAIFGLGGPLVSIGAPKLISQWFGANERGLAMGVYITGASLGNMTSLAVTNAVMMPLFDDSWRSVLLCYAGVVLTAALVWTLIAAHPVSREIERKAAAEPRLPQRQVFAQLFRSRAVRIVLVMSVGAFFINHGFNNWLPEILRSGGMTAEAAGLWAAIPTAVGIMGALTIPRLATPPRRLPIIVGVLLCSCVATQMIRIGGDIPLLIGVIALVMSRGSMLSLLMLILIEAPGVDIKSTGSAGGLFFSAAEVGGMLGPLTLGALSDATGGFAMGLNLLTAIAAALIGLLWLLKREYRRTGSGRA